MDIITYAICKKIAEGAVSGVASMSVSGQTLTINCTDGTVLTMNFPTPADGVSVTDVELDASNHLIVTLSDGSELDAGLVPTAKGDKGNTGDKGADGVSATVRVGTVTSGVSPSVTNSGTNRDAVFDFVLTKGDKGDKGDKGNDGADGKSFDIKAQYPTYAALIAAHPTGEAGDAYFVGTDENTDIYIWLSDDQEWFNNGKIAGVKGDKGDTGDDGFSPVASVSKSGGVATVIIRDKTGQTTTTINDGTEISNIAYKETDVSGNYVYTISLSDGSSYDITVPKGAKGDTGEGIPDGGTTGQVLVKKSGTDYDAEWADPEGGGHIVENDTTALTQRDTLKFEGFTTSDDSTNEKTVVKNPVFVGTTAEWTALSAAEKAKYTLVNLTDDGEGTDEDYRLIATAAANKTYKEQMADLYNAVVGLNERDLLRSALYLSDTEIYTIQNKLDTTNRFSYGNIITDGGGITIHGVRFYNNGGHKIYYCVIAPNSTVTMSNLESETNPGEMKLIVLD